MKHYKLLKNVKDIKIYNLTKDLDINFISSNSKIVKKNSLFIADFNKKIKKSFIKEAIKKGAIAIFSNKFLKNIKFPQFVSNNIKMESILYSLKPYSPGNIIGVTGTNGKTSVLSMVSTIVKYSGIDVNSLGTLGYYKNLKKIENTLLTTPDYQTIYQYAFSSKAQNNSLFIFEISSHGIAQKRINDFPINVAAITNVSHDHLDYHKTFQNYKRIKFKLFTKHLLENGIAILNENIKNIKSLKKSISLKKIKIITYGKKESDINTFIKNKKVYVRVYRKKYLINYNPISKFELENLSCSICCCLSVGISISKIVPIISKIKRPIGRMELVDTLKNGSKVFVDYAHTPDALQNILTANIIKDQKIDLVFGCGGSRDKSKRKKMGRIANNFANKIYVTDDNPREEDPSNIRKTILSSCRRAKEIPNRKIAIKEAIQSLEQNSILIIAGKGHEKKQIYSNRELNCDDVKVAKLIINRINNGKRKFKNKNKRIFN